MLVPRFFAQRSSIKNFREKEKIGINKNRTREKGGRDVSVMTCYPIEKKDSTVEQLSSFPKNCLDIERPMREVRYVGQDLSQEIRL